MDDKYMDENGNIKILDPYFDVNNLFGNGLSAQNGNANGNKEPGFRLPFPDELQQMVKDKFVSKNGPISATAMYPGYDGLGHPSKDIKPIDFPYMDHVPGVYGKDHVVDRGNQINEFHKIVKPNSETDKLIHAHALVGTQKLGDANMSHDFLPPISGPMHEFTAVPYPGIIGSRPFMRIDMNQIQEIANNLKKKSDSILSAYQNECMTALRSGSECLKVSGLDCEDFFKKLDNVYNNISNQINNLSSFITNEVVANYDAVTNVINNKFNGNLASQINSILGSHNGMHFEQIDPKFSVFPKDTM